MRRRRKNQKEKKAFKRKVKMELKMREKEENRREKGRKNPLRNSGRGDIFRLWVPKVTGGKFLHLYSRLQKFCFLFYSFSALINPAPN